MEGFFQFLFEKICPFKFINIFFFSLSLFSPKKQQQIIMIDFTITKLSTHTHTRSHGLTLFRTTIRIEKLNSSKKRSRKKFSRPRALTYTNTHAQELKSSVYNVMNITWKSNTPARFVSFLPFICNYFLSLSHSLTHFVSIFVLLFVSFYILFSFIRSILQQANVLNRLLCAACCCCLFSWIFARLNKKTFSLR